MSRRKNIIALTAARQEREGQIGVQFTDAGRMERQISVGAEFSISCHFDSGAMVTAAELISVYEDSSRIVALEVLTSKRLRIYTADGVIKIINPVLDGDNFVCVVVTQSHTTIYLNDVPYIYTAVNTLIANLLAIGSNMLNWQFFGSHKSVRLFSHPLTAAEAAVLYNEGRPEEYVVPMIMKRQTPQYTLDLSTSILEGGVTYSEGALHYTNANSTHVALWTWGSVAKLPDAISGKNAVGYFEIEVAYATNYDVRMVFGFAFAGNSINTPTMQVVFFKGANTAKLYIPTTNSDALGKPWYGLAKWFNAWIYKSGNSSIPEGDLDLTITSVSVRAVGVIAEYLPQNIQPTKADQHPFKTLTGINSFTWDGVESQHRINVPFAETAVWNGWYRINLTISNYEAGRPYIYLGAVHTIPAANGTYDVLCRITNKSYLNYIPTYGGAANTDRRLTLTINSITYVDKLAHTWLDSAKQLPLNDEYLPPMLQSDGGLDMVANGIPEILLKP